MKLNRLVACSVLSCAASVALVSNGNAQHRISRIDDGSGIRPQVDAVGDWNGDGLPDFVYTSGPVSPGRLLIHAATASNGQSLSLFIEGFAESIATITARGVGDTDNDGLDDIAIANAEAGTVQVYSVGPIRPRLSIQRSAPFGSSLDGIGDVNGDGFDDLIVGEVNVGGSGARAHILSGLDGSVIRVSPIGAPNTVRAVVSGLGDTSGDGVPDYAIVTIDDLGYSRGVFFDGATGNAGIQIVGTNAAWAGSADFTGDGVDDLVIRLGDGIVGLNAGVPQWHKGPPIGAELGDSFAPLGDVNGDGLGDVAIPIHRFAGEADLIEIVSGADGTTIRQIVVDSSEAPLVANAGDVAGSGRNELLVSTGFPNAVIQVFDVGPGGLPSERIFGASCAGGTLTRPIIGFRGRPSLNSTLRPISNNGPTFVTATLLIGAANAAPLDLFGLAACALYVQPVATVQTTTDAIGSSEVGLSIPLSGSLIGLALTMQWVTEGPSSAQLPIQLSNGLQVTVGF